MNPKMEIEITAYAKEIMQTNNGLVKEEEVVNAKKCLLVDSILQYHYLVGHKKTYPSNNELEMELDLDIIILTRSRYMELKETEANYLKLCN